MEKVPRTDHFFTVFIITTLLSATLVSSECTCEEEDLQKDSKSATLKLRIVAIFLILAAGTIGVAIPILGKKIPSLRPESNLFFMIKAFAAGVILATGFIHVLPESFERLSSPCLSESPWHNFPFTGFIAMVAAIGTLMVESSAAGYYRRMHFRKINDGGGDGGVRGDVEKTSELAGHVRVHVHTHTSHGHAHGASESLSEEDLNKLELIRHRVTSQVLELGIMVHSVIIGITIGASHSLDTIKTLMAALSFHQFFEGMGLGGCITQARFNNKATMLMGLFFSLTTPLGIAIGIGISNSYSENTPTSLIVQGVLDSAAAGILIYMALVDLLAADFMNPKVQNNTSLQWGANISLLLGAGCMSVLAKWA